MISKLIANDISESQKVYCNYTSRETQAFLSALDRALYDGTFAVSLVHWAKKIDAERLVRITYVLSNMGFVVSSVRKNWAELVINQDKLYSLVPKTEVDTARKYYKFRKYAMVEDTNNYPAVNVKVGNNVKQTGLSRRGFASVAKLAFKLDTAKLEEYYQPIYENVVKTITRAIEKGKLKDPYFDDKANYEQVAKEVLDYYLNYDGSYNLEYCLADARGRAIFGALKRIANPISSKDIRALLVASQATILNKFSTAKLQDIYLFIAELNGSKATKQLAKIADGMEMYNRRELPELDLDTEAGRKSMYELIWLERIYDKLDLLATEKVVHWDIPLEVDARMSINQFVGALTNDERLLTRTCVIGDELQDAWAIEGVRRNSAKKVGTPVFYGSSQTARKLLKQNGIDIQPDEVKAINNEFRKGAFAVTKAFRDAVIGNYNNHAPVISVQIWDETFNVECNKFKTVGATVQTTIAWDTQANKVRLARTREPILVPDYRAFKLYWATCCIHNLDSQVINKIAEEFTSADEWLLTIHDAALALPGTCGRIRASYAQKLKEINTNRHTIVNNFRESIGAVGHKADVSFLKVHKLVQQAPDVAFNSYAMK